MEPSAFDWEAVVDGATMIAAVLAFIVSVRTFTLTRRHLAVERVHRLTERMYDLDRTLLGSPEIQRFLSAQAGRTSPYFCDENLHDEFYYKVRTYIVVSITSFDEVISIVQGDAHLEREIEFPDWQNYIVDELRHPLFRELYRQQARIWGKKFNAFVAANRAAIDRPNDESELAAR